MPSAEAAAPFPLVGVVGETGALQPDMHRRRHRAARPGLALVEDAPLGIVEMRFIELLVARHRGFPRCQ